MQPLHFCHSKATKKKGNQDHDVFRTQTHKRRFKLYKLTSFTTNYKKFKHNKVDQKHHNSLIFTKHNKSNMH